LKPAETQHENDLGSQSIALPSSGYKILDSGQDYLIFSAIVPSFKIVPASALSTE
jgi:hypothetical protein